MPRADLVEGRYLAVRLISFWFRLDLLVLLPSLVEHLPELDIFRAQLDHLHLELSEIAARFQLLFKQLPELPLSYQLSPQLGHVRCFRVLGEALFQVPAV